MTKPIDNLKKEDAGLPTDLYRPYHPFLHSKSKPVLCRLHYLEVHKMEEQLVDFGFFNRIRKGHYLWRKKANYIFTFDTTRAGRQVGRLLQVTDWDALTSGYQQASLQREQLLGKQTRVFSDENMEGYRELRKENVEIIRLQVFNSKLYRVEFMYEDGRELDLRRSEYDLRLELLPLAMKLLG